MFFFVDSYSPPKDLAQKTKNAQTSFVYASKTALKLPLWQGF
jgi:hypothetical protein